MFESKPENKGLVYSFKSDEVFFEDRNSRLSKSRIKIILIVVGIIAVLGVIIGLVAWSVNEDSQEKTTPVSHVKPVKCSQSYQPTLVISLGAAGTDYYSIKSLQTLKQNGVTAEFLRPVYPTNKYPNTFSIVTGLYPESHGLIDDKFFDLNLKQHFDSRKVEFWNTTEPIWNTARKQGKITGVYSWPGYDLKIQGLEPNLSNAGIKKENVTALPMTILKWLQLDQDSRPDLILAYLDRQKLYKSKENVSHVIEEIMKGLEEIKMLNCVNLIIVSDHGLTETSCNKMVVLNSVLSSEEQSKIFIHDYGTTGRISNFYKYKQTILDPVRISLSEITSRVECMSGHLRVNNKKSLPKRVHYSNNPRIDDLVLEVDEHWWISRTGSKKYCNGMKSGYDNIYSSMNGIFVGHGPAFKDGIQIDGFENIELVNLLCDLLKIQAPDNNGTKGRLYEILKSPPKMEATTPTSYEICEINTACSSQCKVNIKGISALLPEFKDKDSVCLVVDDQQISAYSKNTGRLIWMSYVLSQDQLNSVYRNSECTSCLSAFHNLTVSSPSDNKEIWLYLRDILEEYRVKYGELSVTVGPVYDVNSNGVLDQLEYDLIESDNKSINPTHHFVIVTKCKDKTESMTTCRTNQDVLSLIIPHGMEDKNCMLKPSYLKRNVARLRDIELLTNLKFYADVPIAVATRLQTYLPLSIWPSESTVIKQKDGDWMDEPCPSANSCSSEYQPLLLISLDGFRADYIDYGMTPTIKHLGECGVTVPYMRSVYPTKTFPNHYSQVTGLYPESHGIVDNSMFDAGINKTFKIGSPNGRDPRWWGGEPIWLTAKRQGKRSASYFWVGSDVDIDGDYPNIYRYYSGSVSYYDRVETVVRWLKQGEITRPDIVTLYFDEPDHMGHVSGTNSEPVKEELRRVDNTIKILMNELYQSDLHHCVNIILVADHGMSNISCDRVNDLSKVLDKDEMDNIYVYQGAFGRIATAYKYKSSKTVPPVQQPISEEELLSKLRCNIDGKVYTPADIPTRFHYSNNPRIDNIIIDNNDGWTVAKKFNAGYCKGGQHGYDNTYRSMRALFTGFGPAFKTGLKSSQPFDNIELYNLMCDIIGVTPAPNNGTRGSLNYMLVKPSNVSVPDSLLEYTDLHIDTDTRGITCGNCNNITDAEIDNFKNSLQESWNKHSDLTYQHLPFGLPLILDRNRNVSLIYQRSHITGYDSTIQAPRWISATVNNKSQSESKKNSQCIYQLTDQNSCRNQSTGCSLLLDIIERPDTPLAIFEDIMELPEDFCHGVWKSLQELILTWVASNSTGNINIITGPVYDYNHDSLPDEVLRLNRSVEDGALKPSHIFIIISKCNITESPLPSCTELQTISYILPVTANLTKNCQTAEEYLIDHEVRIRDIELITNLQFYSNITNSLQLRLFLSHSLW